MEKIFVSRIIDRIGELLPRMAEDGAATLCPVRKLRERLAADFSPAGAEVTDTALDCCLLMLRLAGVLDPQRLKQGEVCFISYPARTAGISLLRLLARQERQDDAGIYPRGFWTETEGDDVKKERRALLEKIARHLDADPQEAVVRHSHVSFALLGCNGRFLCHKREIPANDGDTKKGVLVLPGGRLEVKDFPPGNEDEHIRRLTGPEGLGPYADAAHLNALKRELREELHLEEHMYEARPYKELPPYRGCHGGGDRHALTSTSIRLYQISLKPEAMPVLFTYFRKEHALLWCSPKELLDTGRNAAGEKIFFDAAWGHLSLEELDALEESTPFPCRAASRTRECLLSPGSVQIRATQGMEQSRGGRPPKGEIVPLSSDQSQLLLALGLARANFSLPGEASPAVISPLVSRTSPPLCVEQAGGILVRDKAILRIYGSLPEKLRACCWHSENHIRLLEDFLMTRDYFSYDVRETGKGRVRLWRNAVDLPDLGLHVPESHIDMELKEKALALFLGEQVEPDTIRKSTEVSSGIRLQEYARRISLERLISPDGGLLISLRQQGKGRP